MKTGIWMILFAVFSASSTYATPQSVNYQGSLTHPDGSPLDTAVTMTFKLWSAPAAGILYWTETDASVNVTGGLFNVSLGQTTALADSILDHSQLWLGVTVGADVEMTPRVPLNSVAYSYRVGTIDGATAGSLGGDLYLGGRAALGANAIGGADAFAAGYLNFANGDQSSVTGGQINFANGTGSHVGGGQYNRARGDYSVVGGGGGGGSLDSNSAAGDYSVVGGGAENSAAGNNATVGGGRNNSASQHLATIGGGGDNTASGDYSTVAGGNGNSASNPSATVSGGISNAASGLRSFVGGGESNLAQGSHASVGGGFSNNAAGSYATIAGGYNNIAQDSAYVGGGRGNSATGGLSVVGGGTNNTASGDFATVVGGGEHNVATSYSSVIAGGVENTNNGIHAAIGGGFSNNAQGHYSVIPGGFNNGTQGFISFAAGSDCHVNGDHSFAWCDGADTLTINANNTFNALATGGVRFWTAVPISDNIGARLPAGGSAWIALSDSTKKRNARVVDTKIVLERVTALPIKQWSYRSQDASIEHISPMAQDFWNQFHIGDDSLSISTIDPSGIALAAIQELAKQVKELKDENQELRAQLQTVLAREQRTQR